MADLIDRQMAIDALCKSECGWNNAECRYKDDTDFCVTCDNVKIIKSLSSVQPERMKGRWLPDNNCVYEMRFVCSVCKESEVVPTIGFTKYKPIWDFCPNCGVDMRGEQE